MSAGNTPRATQNESNEGEELGSTKLWTVYITEAEKYDKALLTSWMRDMNGVLIFAGLFSASLTAFLIESYKSLSPDQGTIMLATMAQISRQLKDPGNESSIELTTLLEYAPPPSSLACNFLWFISLGLSLCSALLATLVEQWARDFIRRTELRPAPIMRAHIFSYLYFGLHRFGMHTVVDFIPVLLHISLLLFFAGLIAFLLPISTRIMVLVATMLALILVAYLYFTMHPVLSSDSPYRTPLSTISWALLQRYQSWVRSLKQYLGRRSRNDELTMLEVIIDDTSVHISRSDEPTMLEVMIDDAVRISDDRKERDTKAILWTLRSLSDNDEFEPFVEALPGLIWGPKGQRHAFDDILRTVLRPDLHLVSRIESLLSSCDSDFLLLDHKTRRQFSCLKALWAVAYFCATQDSSFTSFPSFNYGLLDSVQLQTSDTKVRACLISTQALVELNSFQAVCRSIRNLRARQRLSGTESLLKMVQKHVDLHGSPEFACMPSNFLAASDTSGDASGQWDPICQLVTPFEERANAMIFKYWKASACLRMGQYEFDATSSLLKQHSIGPSWGTQMERAILTQWEVIFVNIIKDNMEHWKNVENIHPVDIILSHILDVLQEHVEVLEASIISSLAWYINQRADNVSLLQKAFERCSGKFVATLLLRYLPLAPRSDIQNILHSIWRLCNGNVFEPCPFDDQTLIAIQTTHRFPISILAIAMVKWNLHHINRWDVLIEMLESCANLESPTHIAGFDIYRSITLEYMTSQRPGGVLLVNQQQSFASSLASLVDDTFITGEARTVNYIIHWFTWNNFMAPAIELFSDVTARATILSAVEKFRPSQWNMEYYASDHLLGALKAAEDSSVGAGKTAENSEPGLMHQPVNEIGNMQSQFDNGK